MTFLDRFTSIHRLKTFQAAKRSARVMRRAEQNPQVEGPGNPLPIYDTMYILKHGKKAWRAMIANITTSRQGKDR